MKKGLTELVFILDRSGSMHGLEVDTIGGFNAMIDKQKQEEGQALISTVLFDTDSRVLHDRVPLERIAPMTCREYRVGGCTALLDAVGDAIHHIGNVHKYAREEDVRDHHGRHGERQPPLQRGARARDDRSEKGRVRLAVPLPRREHRRGA